MSLSSKAKRCGELVRKQGVGSLINLPLTKFYTLKRLPSYVRSYPITAQIETTNVCNLKCRMCAHSVASWKSRNPRKILTMKEFKVILDKLPHIQFALINGVGEPLMNPNIADMIRYAYSKGIKTAFFTNAALLTPEKAEELLKADGLININVSIDGGKPETYERIRVGAKFSDLCDNIRSFIEIRDEMGKKSPGLSVFMVAMHENVHEIPLLIEIVKDLGGNGLNLHRFLEDQQTEGSPLSLEDIEMLKRYKQEADSKNFILSFGDMSGRITNKRSKRTCVDPWKTTYVNSTGWINPCCYSFYDESAYFGNIFESDFGDIWNGEPYRKFRHELKTGMPACCVKCPKYS